MVIRMYVVIAKIVSAMQVVYVAVHVCIWNFTQDDYVLGDIFIGVSYIFHFANYNFTLSGKNHFLIDKHRLIK